MADQVTITNMPDSGSAEAVAFKLWMHLRKGTEDVDAQLKLFHRCWRAMRGAPDA